MKPVKRILIVGPYGGGKTSFGKKLSLESGLPFFEIDSLFWASGWRPRPREEFLEEVREIADQSEWIIEGHFTKIREIVLPRAEKIIWLDVPLLTAWARLFKRTVSRLRTKELLPHGNKESSTRTFLSNESPLWRLAVDYPKRRAEFETLLRDKTFGSRMSIWKEGFQ